MDSSNLVGDGTLRQAGVEGAGAQVCMLAGLSAAGESRLGVSCPAGHSALTQDAVGAASWVGFSKAFLFQS